MAPNWRDLPTSAVVADISAGEPDDDADDDMAMVGETDALLALLPQAPSDGRFKNDSRNGFSSKAESTAAVGSAALSAAADAGDDEDAVCFASDFVADAAVAIAGWADWPSTDGKGCADVSAAAATAAAAFAFLDALAAWRIDDINGEKPVVTGVRDIAMERTGDDEEKDAGMRGASNGAGDGEDENADDETFGDVDDDDAITGAGRERLRAAAAGSAFSSANASNSEPPLLFTACAPIRGEARI